MLLDVVDLFYCVCVYMYILHSASLRFYVVLLICVM